MLPLRASLLLLLIPACGNPNTVAGNGPGCQNIPALENFCASKVPYSAKAYIDVTGSYNLVSAMCVDPASKARIAKVEPCVASYKKAFDDEENAYRDKSADKVDACRSDPDLAPAVLTMREARDEESIAKEEWRRAGGRQGTAYERRYSSKQKAAVEADDRVRAILKRHDLTVDEALYFKLLK